MRTLAAISALLFAVSAAVAQSDSYKVGEISIVVPPPPGYENVIDAIPNDHGRFSANPTAGLLALHLPSGIVPKLFGTPLMPLDMYTRVVMSPQVRDRRITEALFAQVVVEYKKGFDNLYDPNGSVMTNAKKNVSLWTSQVRGRVTNVDFSKPQNLGYFNESANSFSSMFLNIADFGGQKVPMLVSTSMLRLHERLVNVSVYKRQPTDADIEALTKFTNDWTANILAANK